MHTCVGVVDIIGKVMNLNYERKMSQGTQVKDDDVSKNIGKGHE